MFSKEDELTAENLVPQETVYNLSEKHIIDKSALVVDLLTILNLQKTLKFKIAQNFCRTLTPTTNVGLYRERHLYCSGTIQQCWPRRGNRLESRSLLSSAVSSAVFHGLRESHPLQRMSHWIDLFLQAKHAPLRWMVVSNLTHEVSMIIPWHSNCV